MIHTRIFCLICILFLMQGCGIKRKKYRDSAPILNESSSCAYPGTEAKIISIGKLKDSAVRIIHILALKSYREKLIPHEAISVLRRKDIDCIKPAQEVKPIPGENYQKNKKDKENDKYGVRAFISILAIVVGTALAYFCFSFFSEKVLFVMLIAGFVVFGIAIGSWIASLTKKRKGWKEYKNKGFFIGATVLILAEIAAVVMLFVDLVWGIWYL